MKSSEAYSHKLLLVRLSASRASHCSSPRKPIFGDRLIGDLQDERRRAKLRLALGGTWYRPVCDRS